MKFKKADGRLVLYILAGTLIYSVFSEFESVLSLYLAKITRNPGEIFSILLMINSVCGLVFQFILVFWSKHFKGEFR